MTSLYIVIDRHEDWAPYCPTASVITADDFLRLTDLALNHKGAMVLNLCRDQSYLSPGYYCSLLAEARGAKVVPSVRVINDLANFGHDALIQMKLPKGVTLPKPAMDTPTHPAPTVFRVFFGACADPALRPLARALFEQYMAPILDIIFRPGAPCVVEAVALGNLGQLNDAEQTLFAESLDAFSRKVWPTPRRGKTYRYELAILHDPDDSLPPSNPKALRQFVKAGQDMGLQVELIARDDYSRLAEFDALFIRETTAVTNHTYRFAKRAEHEGLVVIDASTAILRCTNKVFLKELLEINRIPTPRTRLLIGAAGSPPETVLEQLGAPVILKVPDGSFSIGVEKANNARELSEAMTRLFARSSILLAQEFVPTDFDWRIGVLDGRPFYACKYAMARGHWQIYNHAATRFRSGEAETVGIPRVPKPVLQIAARACRLIGDGLFGVDIKERHGEAMVIEINDNPSIDAGIEDAHLGDEIYRIIMGDFVRRLDEVRR